MRNYFTLLLLVIAFSVKAQDTLTVDKPVEVPQIVVKAPMGELVDLGEISIKLKSVLTDSRCPTNAQCIWAGEAIAMIEVYRDGNFIEERKLKFTPVNALLDIYFSDAIKASGYSLLPYPEVSGHKIEQEDYVLTIKVIENQ